MTTWILVSDSSRARLFSTSGDQQKEWQLVRELNHPESRAHETDLVDGERGRTQQSFGHGSRPAMEPTSTQKEVESESFAQELTRLLDHEFDVHAFESLVLVAPPGFLGRLRKHMPAKIDKCIVAAIDKDYTAETPRSLQSLLGASIASPKA